MTGIHHLVDTKMFSRFHELLTSEAPGYTPWYFLLMKAGKDPVPGIPWKQIEGRLTFDEALKKMRAGHNIGIAATGMDPLCIMDVDDIEATPDEIVKPTLSSRSRKRIGMHYFFFTDDPRCKENLPTEEMGEIRSNFQYVVAPGSFVLCNDKTLAAMPESQRELAGRYTIENERSPNTIVFSEMPPVFLEQAKKNGDAKKKAKKEREAKAKARKDKKSAQGTQKNKSALWDLSMDDVTGNISTAKNRFPSLFHASSTGKNTSETDNGGLSCWRHLVTHTPLSALCVVAGISDCLDAGQGHGGGKASGIDYDDGQTIFRMWEYAKHNGILPEEDPIPTNALVWYATEQGICRLDEVVDGWKLPVQAYNQTLELIEAKEDILTGRGGIGTSAAHVQESRKAASEAFVKHYSNYIEMAEQIQTHNPIHFDTGRNYWVWSWNTRSYHAADETDILIAIQDATDQYKATITSKDKNEMLEAIRTTGRRHTPKEVPARWIQFKDCVVDIDTGVRFDATPGYFFVNPIPYCLSHDEATPTIDRLIGEWVAESDKEIMYEIMAYCLYTKYPIHRIFFLLGAGRNGKSQYMGIIKHLLGRDGWTSSTIEMLLENRFEGAKLYKKHAVFIGETDFKMIKKTDMLKRMSGDDPIRCEFKGKTPIDFDNYAKLIIGTNSIPETADTTKGYYSRFVIVDFPNEFDLGTPIIDFISSEEYENLCCKLVGVLKDLLAAGEFKNEGSLEERKTRYIKKASSLTAFIDEKCVVDFDEMVPFWEFYDAYSAYVEVSGQRKLSKTAVGSWLSDEGYERHQERHGEKNWLTIFGLYLKKVKQSQLISDDSVDGVDGVEGFPTTPYTCPQRGILSTPSTPSTNSRPIAVSGVDGVDGYVSREKCYSQQEQMKTIDLFFREHKSDDGKHAEISYASQKQLVELVPEIAQLLNITEKNAFSYVMQYGKDRGWV